MASASTFLCLLRDARGEYRSSSSIHPPFGSPKIRHIPADSCRHTGSPDIPWEDPDKNNSCGERSNASQSCNSTQERCAKPFRSLLRSGPAAFLAFLSRLDKRACSVVRRRRPGIGKTSWNAWPARHGPPCRCLECTSAWAGTEFTEAQISCQRLAAVANLDAVRPIYFGLPIAPADNPVVLTPVVLTVVVPVVLTLVVPVVLSPVVPVVPVSVNPVVPVDSPDVFDVLKPVVSVTPELPVVRPVVSVVPCVPVVIPVVPVVIPVDVVPVVEVVKPVDE